MHLTKQNQNVKYIHIQKQIEKNYNNNNKNAIGNKYNIKF